MTRTQKLISFGVLLIILGVVGWLISRAPAWAWHPLGACSGTHAQITACRSYNLWSGIISDISELTLVGGVITLLVGFWRSHNCHVKGCLRLKWHAHPDHGHPVCERHWHEPGHEHVLSGSDVPWKRHHHNPGLGMRRI